MSVVSVLWQLTGYNQCKDSKDDTISETATGKRIYTQTHFKPRQGNDNNIHIKT